MLLLPPLLLFPIGKTEIVAEHLKIHHRGDRKFKRFLRGTSPAHVNQGNAIASFKADIAQVLKKCVAVPSADLKDLPSIGNQELL